MSLANSPNKTSPIAFRVQSKRASGPAGKILISLFFLVFLGLGLLFAWLMGRDVIAGLQTRTWQKTPCEILTSDVREIKGRQDNVGGFAFEVTYRYSFNGETFTSDQYKPEAKTFADYTKAARLAERYRPETSTQCYVNPYAPNQAILERDSLLFPLALLFPMVFVVIGAGGLYLTWRPSREAMDSLTPITDNVATKGLWVGIIFFSIFFLVGSVLLYAFFLRPLYKIVLARNWSAVPCVVVSSEVKEHRDSDGSTYSVNILYRYEFNGREFKSNRYDFSGGSSSGYGGKRSIVSRLPPGTETVCYVNPADPTEAVLQRGLTPTLWVGLVPLLFAVAGGAGVLFTIRKASNSFSRRVGDSYVVFGNTERTSDNFDPLPQTNAPKVLKPKMSPLAKLLVVTAIALIWNGIISIFLVQVVKGWRAGHPDWFHTIFMLPFVAVGLGLVVGVFYSLLALFNPRPRLTVTPGAVPLGGTLRVEWEITGRTDKLQAVRVRLEGREEATYRRGTDTCTDKSIFADIDVAHITSPMEMRSGSQTIIVPYHLMHSFAGNNNKIVYSITLHGEIAHWPDVKEEFPITVLPAQPRHV